MIFFSVGTLETEDVYSQFIPLYADMDSRLTRIGLCSWVLFEVVRWIRSVSHEDYPVLHLSSYMAVISPFYRDDGIEKYPTVLEGKRAHFSEIATPR